MGIIINGLNDTVTASDHSLNLGGNVTIPGQLSYDDVTSIDSIGIVTARNGIDVSTGNVTITENANLMFQNSARDTNRGAIQFTDGGIFRVRSGALLTERLRITSDGQIGMGIASPTQESGTGLHIRGANGGQTRIHLTNSDTGDAATDGFYIISQGAESGGASGEVMLQQKENKALKFATNNTERLRITSAGDMGLGTDSPRSITNFGSFAINGTAGAFTDYFLNGTRTGTTAVDSNGFTSEAVGSSTPFRVITNGSERLRIISSGEISMGGFTPIASAGVLQISGGLRVAGTASASDTTTPYIYRTSGVDNLNFATSGVERVRIASTGTLESYSTNDTTPNIRWRSDDTNWFGALNQSVHGGTITTFLSCGGDWTANGTTYSATKALAAYPTSAIAVHNQYNSTWGTDFVFLSKSGGSSTTDGAVYEKLRINAKAEIIQTSATTSTNSWYSLNSNNTVKVTNGDNDIYIERVGGSAGYDQLVYKKTPMTDNCDISFRLSGSQPGGTWRHIGITICGDGGSNFANMDRIVIRQQGATGGGDNRIRVDKAGGGTTADVTSGSIPSFFDGTERNVLIQIRGNIVHVLSDNVLVFSEQMNASLHSITGFFGIGIYETTGNIRLRNFQITNYGALGVPQKRPCLQTNMSSTYGSSGSLTTNTAQTGILQANAYIDLCGNYTTSGSNAYTFECPVDGVYAVNAHISMGGGSYARHIWVMSYTMGGGNLPLGTYTEVIDLVPDQHSNHSYYNLWKFTKGTRVGMGINSGSGSLSGRGFQWGIMLVS